MLNVVHDKVGLQIPLRISVNYWTKIFCFHKSQVVAFHMSSDNFFNQLTVHCISPTWCKEVSSLRFPINGIRLEVTITIHRSKTGNHICLRVGVGLSSFWIGLRRGKIHYSWTWHSILNIRLVSKTIRVMTFMTMDRGQAVRGKIRRDILGSR